MFRNTKSAALIVCLLLPVPGFTQELNKKIMDPESDQEIMFGYCDRSGLESGDFGKLFREYYDIYEPEKSIISQLKSKHDGVEILVVLGTWCSDSQEQVPKFFKVLDKIKFDRKDVQMICVDGKKEAGLEDFVNYDIQKVPTFIIYRKGREIGRIIETPYSTLEKDLLMFFVDN